MPQRLAELDPIDELFLERAYELAERGIGSTSPNPAVGALVARGDRIAGEGYHHRAGDAHAEVYALRAAGDAAQGATLYVSLEPCNHRGRTPACTNAIAQAGVARLVVGTLDPNPKTNGGGIAALRRSGIAVVVADDARAKAIVEPFARGIRAERPYVALKMATSLDGYVTSRPGEQQWLTGAESREFVRELRIAHDAVAVGAGTVRVDNPQLTLRPPHHRLREYVRVAVCETDAVDPESAIFAPQNGYAKTIVIAPAGARDRFKTLEPVADLLYAGADGAVRLDLMETLRLLRERGIASLLFEGGPTLARRLLTHGVVDRLYWLVAPRLLGSDTAVPALSAGDFGPDLPGLHVDRVERLGPDLLLSGTLLTNV